MKTTPKFKVGDIVTSIKDVGSEGFIINVVTESRMYDEVPEGYIGYNVIWYKGLIGSGCGYHLPEWSLALASSPSRSLKRIST